MFSRRLPAYAGTVKIFATSVGVAAAYGRLQAEGGNKVAGRWARSKPNPAPTVIPFGKGNVSH